jgi:protein-S-isoprenylcysteine O-methyltransferase Ste14
VYKEEELASIILKSILGFAFLMLVLALALFLSAGSLRFWQAWAYLAVFGVCTLLITVYLIVNNQKLLASRIKVGPTAETQKSQQIIQSLASVFFVGLFIVSGLDYRYQWSTVPLVVNLISDGFVALGFIVVFLVFKENSYTSAIIEVSKEQKVIDSGPYGLVRHPMYSGASLLLLFSPFALGSWVALPFPILLIIVVMARLLEEEKFLIANLSGYAAYREHVRYRLVPFIW